MLCTRSWLQRWAHAWCLSDYFDHIYGVDPDLFAVEKARLEPYVEVHQGTAEDTGFDSSFFDFVFCWAVFDVVDHAKGFKEANRILKSDGKLLFSGKNSNYYPDDVLAFKAEKNAFLKGFPGRFTNLDIVLKNLKTFGFVLEKLFIFPRRGDFGLLKYEKCIHNNDIAPVGYEYLIICHKVIDQPEAELPLSGALDDRYSITATRAALQAGQGNAKELFESIGIN